MTIYSTYTYNNFILLLKTKIKLYVNINKQNYTCHRHTYLTLDYCNCTCARNIHPLHFSQSSINKYKRTAQFTSGEMISKWTIASDYAQQ